MKKKNSEGKATRLGTFRASLHFLDNITNLSDRFNNQIKLQSTARKMPNFMLSALPVVTSFAVTNRGQFIDSDRGYNDFKFQLLNVVK